MHALVHSVVLGAYGLSSFKIYKLWLAATGQALNAAATATAFFALFVAAHAGSTGDPRRVLSFAALYALKLFVAFLLGVQRPSSDIIDLLVGLGSLSRVELARALTRMFFFVVFDALVILLALWE